MTAMRGAAPARPHRDGRRRSLWAALVAVAAAVLVWASPGVASATVTGSVTPILDCYTQNSDGSWSVILGYTSTYPGKKNIAVGSSNYTNPYSYSTQMPTQFSSGTVHAAVRVKVSYYDMTYNTYWYLDGHTLNYMAAAAASGVCSPSTQLPANGNGTGIAVALVVAGVLGALLVHRLSSRRPAVVPGTDDVAVPAGTEAHEGIRTDA
jgi:uncharacterized membrane-anchored protein